MAKPCFKSKNVKEKSKWFWIWFFIIIFIKEKQHNMTYDQIWSLIG